MNPKSKDLIDAKAVLEEFYLLGGISLGDFKRELCIIGNTSHTYWDGEKFVHEVISREDFYK